MRTHRWLKALACGLCLGAAVDNASAQAPWSGGEWVNADGSPAAAPPGAQTAAAAPAYQPVYSQTDPNAMYPPQTPGGFSPWPAVSPYGMGNYAIDSHYNHGGTWFRQVLNKRRDYYFSIDALSIIGGAPGTARIGAGTQSLDPNTRGLDGYVVPTYGVGAVGSGTGGNNQQGGATTEPTSRVFMDRGVIPFPFMQQTGDVTPVAIVDSTLFPLRNFNLFGDFRTAGAQMNWGFFDESGFGIKATGWWGLEEDQTFQRGRDVINGIPLTQDIIVNQAGRMLFTRNGAVAWDTGIPTSIVGSTTDPGNDGGVVGAQKYDVMYRMNVTSEFGGGDLQMYLSDLLTDQYAVRVRPVYSAKYMYLGESFQFRGVDSGMSYGFDGDDGGTTGGGGGNGTQTGSTYRPDTALTINSDLFESRFNAYTYTHLAGPTAGLRFDLGHSQNFNIWGQANFGLMANYEQIRISGFNAGENVATEFILGNNMLTGDSSFYDRASHAHVSPLFEGSINAESKVLGEIPLIKEVPLLAAAKFKVGFTQTVVGHVARPWNSVKWYGFPKEPKVSVDYQTWFLQRFNFGLEWNY